MTDKPKSDKQIKCVALKNLATSAGQVKKGADFTCSKAEHEHFKKAKAV